MVAATAQAAVLVDAEAARKKVEVKTVRVIDARDTSELSMFPIPGAIAYERMLQVADKVVLVIADEDRDALAAARELGQRHPGLTAVALQDGYETLRRLRPEAKLPAHLDGAMPSNFTIPSDTCETGPALQTYGGDEQ
jgi:hypothetical protein